MQERKRHRLVIVLEVERVAAARVWLLTGLTAACELAERVQELAFPRLPILAHVRADRAALVVGLVAPTAADWLPTCKPSLHVAPKRQKPRTKSGPQACLAGHFDPGLSSLHLVQRRALLLPLFTSRPRWASFLHGAALAAPLM